MIRDIAAAMRLPIARVFLCHGLLLGTWATQVPLVRLRLRLPPLTLGLALLCVSLGALATMPMTGRLLQRLGLRAVLRAGSAATAAALLAAVAAPGLVALCAALLAFGVGFGLVDVAMNASSVQVERQAGRPILGTVHAMWSVGAGTAAGAGGALLSAGLPGLAAAALAATLALAGVWTAAARLPAVAAMPAASPTAAPAAPRHWRDPGLLLAGTLMCIAFAVEGAIGDWGGIWLNRIRHVAPSQAAFGYSAFSFSTVVARLLGDRLRARWGDRAVLRWALLGGAGLGLALATPWPWALAGFALTGIGIGNVVPVLFARAGARGGAASTRAIGVVTTLGYAGVLAGPPLFGALAQATSLTAALGTVALLCCAVAAAAPAVAPPTQNRGLSST